MAEDGEKIESFFTCLKKSHRLKRNVYTSRKRNKALCSLEHVLSNTNQHDTIVHKIKIKDF